MKRKVPKKNISSRIADIETPRDKEEHRVPKRIFSDDLIKEEVAERFFKSGESECGSNETGRASILPKRSSLKRFFAVFLVSGLLVAGWFGFETYRKWSSAFSLFSAAGERLGRITGSEEELGKPDEEKSFFGGFDFQKLKVLLGGAGDAYRSFQDISTAAFDLAQEIDALQNEWPDVLFGNQRGRLAERLKKMKSDITLISEANEKLAAAHSDLGNFFPGAAASKLSFESDISRFENFLGSLIDLLESPRERHVLVLFGNSSELRPGGGFLGSYADVVLENGGVQSIKVHDINDADRELDAKIVPPKPLQAIVTRWRAADANWFFDYSLSSAKVIQLIEESKKYSRASVTFDGAVAISPNVVNDVLETTGPIRLPGRSAAIDDSNFLTEIQKEVQLSQESDAPKKILKELTPVLLDALTKLRSEEKSALFRKFGEWLEKKDVMLYFKESGLERFFDFYGVSGKVFDLPKNFNGDYLAAVNANVGGGKTDLFIQQKIFFKTQLNLDGTASDHLTISREHQGNTSDSWWYRTPNENYLQVFTLPGAMLSNFSGGWDRKIFPKINYAKSGYAIDPLMAEIESKMKKDFQYPLVSVFEASGKNIFAAWVKTDSGKTSKIVLDYKIRLFAPPADGQNYQFVFEKQSGSHGEYQFELYAPVGFRWKENKSPVFEHATDNPPGRLMFNLTLEKS